MKAWPVLAAAGVFLSTAPAGAFSWTLGGATLRPAGYMQNDARAFAGWDADPGQRNDGFDIRHMRIGVQLRSARVTGQAIFDVAGFANRALGDDVSPMFTPRQRFKDMYLDVAWRKGHFLRAGHFKVPVSREFLVAEQRTDFIERAMFASGLGPSRDWGVMAHGGWPSGLRLEYLAGAFGGDNWADASRARRTVAGRVVVQPWLGLRVGVSGSRGELRAQDGDGRMRPRSLQGKNASGWVFSRRAEVDGERRRLGADVQYAAGPVTLTVEILESRETRRSPPLAGGLAPLAGVGWSATALWRVRGPRRGEEAAAAPFDVALRYDALRFDAGAAPPPSSRALTAAVNHQPRPWLRLMANGIVDRYGPDARTPAGPGRSYVTFLGRLQLLIP